MAGLILDDSFRPADITVVLDDSFRPDIKVTDSDRVSAAVLQFLNTEYGPSAVASAGSELIV